MTGIYYGIPGVCNGSPLHMQHIQVVLQQSYVVLLYTCTPDVEMHGHIHA
jgi:hypothetical protein